MSSTKDKISIILSGCGGYMGKVITQLIKNRDDLEIVAGIDKMPPANVVYPVFLSFDDCTIDGDVIIDFTRPDNLKDMIKFALAKKISLVIATTGYSKKQIETIETTSQEISIFQSSSLSVGINLLKKLLMQAAPFLEDDFDIEIIERHHNRKVDAPSGTAIMLADAINDSLKEKKQYNFGRSGNNCERSTEIGIHAIRGGTIVGEHEIIFAGNDEIIELKHISLSRDSFATGAIRAALFITTKTTGLYNMDDML